MILKNIAEKSLLNRKSTTFLTVISIALSVALLLGIERIRSGARQSFESTISGVDLIAGARSGPVNLLLYSVFRIGNATNNISYESYEEIVKDQNVLWSIPISLGDSYRGYRVVGTTSDYFKYYRYSGDRSLLFQSGQPFQELFDVVLGSEVAKKLQIQMGQQITLSHGADEVSFQEHDDKPFSVVGILNQTGTPVDRSVHVSLEAIRALHVDWKEGAPPREGEQTSAKTLRQMDLKPSDITAFFIRLKSRLSVFNVQRQINEYQGEAMMAVLPGVGLRDLWETIGLAENALMVVSFFVLVVSLVGMVIALLSTLNERRREMAILRSVGAKRRFIFTLLLFETALLCFAGIVLGVIFLYIGLWAFRPLLETQLGLTLGLFTPSVQDGVYLGMIFFGSLVAGLIPSWKAYHQSLSDGLMIKN